MSDHWPLEPLARLARFSWDWAPALCRPEHGCRDYHRSWSLVRLLELDGALPAGLPFFARELAALAQSGQRRVLVSGGADTGVTSLVVSSMRAAGAEPELVFVDRCATPCTQNWLLARELGVQAQILTMDAREIACAPVQAVVAHSFLHLLPSEVRQPVIQAWARVLQPGGKVLMSSALSEDESDWVRVKDPARISQRRSSLEGAALRAGWTAAEAAEAAGTAARFWATSPGRPPALTEAALRRAFAEAGLRIVRLDLSTPGERRGPVALTTLEGSRRRRAEVVALRD